VAHRCDSDAVDYRYAKTTIQACQLPIQVAASCVAITKQLKLRFSGIDLIQTEKGWVLLEVNTAPGFSYFEGDGGGVSALLHQYLCKEAAHMQKQGIAQ
jgi:glutathione synthase/RimK-type ligase-like ATP-grasp enzyme